ncbi:MAG: hypothetical protein A2Y95_05615 [Deltaproteobacteria bacterium RBG_13_65_10]|nr:MAG: hypothetical protein A2Y95_05615 [Deltaproteobacteria bacterium RBG_13_65_10]
MSGSIRKVPAVVVAVAIFVIFAATPRACRAQARASTDMAGRLDDALARLRALTESPTGRRRPELWDQAAARFEAIRRADPGAPRADEAAYLLGEVYYERYHVFRAPADLDRAIAAYRHVVARYPHSAYADDALYQLGEIHYYQLGDTRSAYVQYRRIVREHPGSDMAQRARIRLAALDQAQAAPSTPISSARAVVGHAPSGRKPLSSPGAVLGELPGGRRTVILDPPSAEIPEAPRRASRKERALQRAARPEAPVKQVSPKASAPAAVAPRGGYARSRNPLLEEGPIPLRKPSDALPRLPASGRL